MFSWKDKARQQAYIINQRQSHITSHQLTSGISVANTMIRRGFRRVFWQIDRYGVAT
jgi:hypothetical protein